MCRISLQMTQRVVFGSSYLECGPATAHGERARNRPGQASLWMFSPCSRGPFRFRCRRGGSGGCGGGGSCGGGSGGCGQPRDPAAVRPQLELRRWSAGGGARGWRRRSWRGRRPRPAGARVRPDHLSVAHQRHLLNTRYIILQCRTFIAGFMV